MTQKIIRYPEISLLSFPDSEVLSVDLHSNKKELNIKVDRAYLDNDGGKIIGTGIIKIFNWEQATYAVCNPEGIWDFEFDTLKDILNFLVTKSEIIICGFGKSTNKWVKYTFIGSQLNYTYIYEL